MGKEYLSRDGQPHPVLRLTLYVQATRGDDEAVYDVSKQGKIVRADLLEMMSRLDASGEAPRLYFKQGARLA